MSSTKYVDSIELVRKCLRGKKLTKDEFKKILSDALSNKLPDVALAAFIVRQELKPFTLDEIADLTLAMVVEVTL